MDEMWEQVKEVKEGNRHELLISGKILSKALDDNDGNLDSNIFDQHQLNFIRLSSSSLELLPDQIGNLENLTNLELQSNNLKELPSTIGELSKLKLLDVSENKIESLPAELSKLTSLVTLNARQNLLKDLPTFENCSSISSIDVRMNKLQTLQDLSWDNLGSVTELQASYNEIEELPSGVMNLKTLKVLTLSNNIIKEVPSELQLCSKLKELDLKGNPLKDRRFKKLVESDRGFAKTLLDYIRQHIKLPKSNENGVKAQNNSKDQSVEKACHELSVMSIKDNSEELEIRVSDDVRSIRGYLVCCILRGLDLTGVNLKKFLSLQTKLHDTVCEKRLAATIATHDLAKIRSPLLYTAKPPGGFEIIPLNKSTGVTAKQFLKTLKAEAELQRKQLKRNTNSGIHKYLSLVDKLENWPCVEDATGAIISFPPITNSQNTKIENETSDVLVEVTSNATLKKAKDVADALVLAVIEGGICKAVNDSGKSQLSVQQVRVLDEEGNFRLVYPSRTDLVWDSEGCNVNVIRD